MQGGALSQRCKVLGDELPLPRRVTTWEVEGGEAQGVATPRHIEGKEAGGRSAQDGRLSAPWATPREGPT